MAVEKLDGPYVAIARGCSLMSEINKDNKGNNAFFAERLIFGITVATTKAK